MSPTFLTPPRLSRRREAIYAPFLLDIWIYLNLIINTILLPLLVITFLVSKRVKRHPVLINLCITWIFSGFFSLLLFYAGQGKGPKEPDIALCIAQTSFLYGIPPMWSVAVFMLLYYILISLHPDPKHQLLSDKKLVFMLSSPYIAQCSFTIAALIIALKHPGDVTRSRRFFYCTLHHGPQLSLAMTAFTSGVCMGIIGVKAMLVITVHRNWRCLRKSGCSSQIDFQLLLRVFVFGVYIVFGMAVNLVPLFDKNSIAPDMYGATVGTVIFLVFGTQPSVLRVWIFWLSRATPRPKYLQTIRESTLKLIESPAPLLPEKDFQFQPAPPPRSKPKLSISVLPVQRHGAQRLVLVNEDYKF